MAIAQRELEAQRVDYDTVKGLWLTYYASRRIRGGGSASLDRGVRYSCPSRAARGESVRGARRTVFHCYTG